MPVGAGNTRSPPPPTPPIMIWPEELLPVPPGWPPALLELLPCWHWGAIDGKKRHPNPSGCISNSTKGGGDRAPCPLRPTSFGVDMETSDLSRNNGSVPPLANPGVSFSGSRQFNGLPILKNSRKSFGSNACRTSCSSTVSNGPCKW